MRTSTANLPPVPWDGIVLAPEVDRSNSVDETSSMLGKFSRILW